MAISVMAFTAGPLDTNCYLVTDEDGGLAVIVDAPWGAARLMVDEIARRSLAVPYLVNTHGHWDHMADDTTLQQATGARIAAHSLDAPRLAAPATIIPLPLEIPPTRVDVLLEDGSVLEVGALRLQVLHTPGHSPGSICLYEPDQRLLLSGDTLFRNGYGRTDLVGSDEDAMWMSLARLSTLPADIRVYPGHGEQTTIGSEEWLKHIASEL